jgi:hypothetical protein
MTDDPDDKDFSRMRALSQAHYQRVKALGVEIGFGATMDYAQRAWHELEQGRGGEFTVGPCAAMMVPCPHPDSEGEAHKCPWCCGSEKITKRVFKAMQVIYGSKSP